MEDKSDTKPNESRSQPAFNQQVRLAFSVFSSILQLPVGLMAWNHGPWHRGLYRHDRIFASPHGTNRRCEKADSLRDDLYLWYQVATY